MRTARPLPKPTPIVIATLLAMVLLCAQWMGLAHRIAHAGWQQNPDVQIQSDRGGESHHSCLAFDAATLADTIYTASFTTQPLPNAHVLALWIAFASWDAPFTAYFSSRAPPLA